MDPRQLREETRTEHEATESLMPLGGSDLTRDVYVQTLRVLLPLISSWEHWAEGAAPQDLREMVRSRRRSQWLEADLQTLTGSVCGLNIGPVPWDGVLRDAAPGEASYRASFLGALYVMEGSTLGGRFIARHAEKCLQLVPGQGDAYFQGHGERTGALWKEVTALLTAVPEEMSPVMVQAARHTFRLFGNVLRENVPAPEPLPQVTSLTEAASKAQ